MEDAIFIGRNETNKLLLNYIWMLYETNNN